MAMANRMASTCQGFGGTGTTSTTGTAAMSAAKLQLVQSPTFRSAPLTEGAFFPGGGRPPGMFTSSLGKKSGLGQRHSMSAGSLEIAEVRALADDIPVKEGMEHLKGPHEALMMRLKSRAARQESEANKVFLAAYRAPTNVPTPQSEAKLDSLLKGTSKRAEELKERSEDLKLEVAEAERKLEKVNTLNCGRATDTELSTMNAFERSQRRIQEDKREEDLQKQRDEVQANYAKVHRRLQNELIELRDFKVLLREFRRIRLEKLHDTLARVADGRRLRATVREMIRHGAQRILQKLEAAGLPFEPWMNEVLVNCCHVEIRIEEAEERLLHVRRQVLLPVKKDVQLMLMQTKQERFDKLCTRALENRQSAQGPPGTAASEKDSTGPRRASAECRSLPAGCADGDSFQLTSTSRRVSDRALEDLRQAEANISSLRRLLNDMRHNAAAVICNQIRQAEKGGGRMAAIEAQDWGGQMLSMLVSEDFAKTTLKELQKSAPQSKLNQ